MAVFVLPGPAGLGTKERRPGSTHGGAARAAVRGADHGPLLSVTLTKMQWDSPAPTPKAYQDIRQFANEKLKAGNCRIQQNRIVTEIAHFSGGGSWRVLFRLHGVYTYAVYVYWGGGISLFRLKPKSK